MTGTTDFHVDHSMYLHLDINLLKAALQIKPMYVMWCWQLLISKMNQPKVIEAVFAFEL